MKNDVMLKRVEFRDAAYAVGTVVRAVMVQHPEFNDHQIAALSGELAMGLGWDPDEFNARLITEQLEADEASQSNRWKVSN